jgi:hypothetical protein
VNETGLQTIRQQTGQSVEDRLLSTLDEAARLLDQIERPAVDDVDRLADVPGVVHRQFLPVVDEFGFDCDVTEIPIGSQRQVKTSCCPVCGECAATPRFAIEGLPYTVVVCDDCGLGSLFPQPTAAEIEHPVLNSNRWWKRWCELSVRDMCARSPGAWRAELVCSTWDVVEGYCFLL